MASRTRVQQWMEQAKQAAAPVVQAMRRRVQQPPHGPDLGGVAAGPEGSAEDVVLQPLQDSHRSREEPGSIGSPTPQEVFLNKTGRELQIDMGR